jgi:hypothetical protein
MFILRVYLLCVIEKYNTSRMRLNYKVESPNIKDMTNYVRLRIRRVAGDSANGYTGLETAESRV